MSVWNYFCARRDQCLLEIRFRNAARATHLCPPVVKPAHNRLVADHLSAEQPRDGALRHIVRCRAKTSRGDDSFATLERFANCRRDGRRRVTYCRPTRDPNPNRRELAREMSRIGIDREAEEKLVSNRYDFDLHVFSRSQPG